MRKAWLALAVLVLPAAKAARIYLVPTRVPWVAVDQSAIRATCSAPGTLDALLNANLGAKASTRVAELMVDVGDRVRAGQVLMRLDRTELADQVREAAAASDAADHQVRVAAAALMRAEVLQGRAARDLRRHESLQVDGLRILSEADLDGTRTQARAAVEDTGQARAALALAVSARGQAGAGLAAARSRLRDATILAPFDGLVTARWKSPGDVVTPGSALLSLVNLPSLVVVARFDESLIGRIRPGAAAHVRFDSAPDCALPGRVARVNRSVDPDTREFTVNVALDALPEAWAMGERARVELPDQLVPSAQTVPAGFLAVRRGRKGLWILKGARAEFNAVAVGIADGTRLEVLTRLPAGTRVLDPRGLWPGMRVAAP